MPAGCPCKFPGHLSSASAALAHQCSGPRFSSRRASARRAHTRTPPTPPPSPAARASPAAMMASPAARQAPRRPSLAARSTPSGRCRRLAAAPPRCSASEQQVRGGSAFSTMPPCATPPCTAPALTPAPRSPLAPQDRHAATPPPLARLARSAAAAAAAGLLLMGPGVPAGLADVTTVTAQQAVDMAKPLKEQKVNKNRIWALFVLGATALFGSTGACCAPLRGCLLAACCGLRGGQAGAGPCACGLSQLPPPLPFRSLPALRAAAAAAAAGGPRAAAQLLTAAPALLDRCLRLQSCWRTTTSGSPQSRGPTKP